MLYTKFTAAIMLGRRSSYAPPQLLNNLRTLISDAECGMFSTNTVLAFDSPPCTSTGICWMVRFPDGGVGGGGLPRAHVLVLAHGGRSVPSRS